MKIKPGLSCPFLCATMSIENSLNMLLFFFYPSSIYFSSIHLTEMDRCSACWFSMVIYSLKVWMFRGEFQLIQKEEKGLVMFVFAACVYLKASYDVHLQKEFLEYSVISTTISRAVSLQFSNHLWYLWPEMGALTFFWQPCLFYYYEANGFSFTRLWWHWTGLH